MTKWKRVDKRGAPEWLYELIGATGSSYWVRYRKEGLKIEQKIEGRIDTWMDARKLGQEIVDMARQIRANGKDLPTLVRCEQLCNEIVSLKQGKSASTYEGNEIMARVHVIPYLNEFCPYISDLNAATWEHYKVHKRLANPTVALFNHWKFFVNLGKYARQKGVIKERIAFSFDEEKEDFRKEGMLIPDEHFRLILKHANQVWRDRATMQRFTGMRPGEVRCLQKDRVQFVDNHAIISLRKEDTKTRYGRSFIVTSAEVLEVLRRRHASPGSDFFFPARGKPEKSMDRSLTGWESAIEAANKELEQEDKPLMPIEYTPHDLRHTFLTREFKKPGNNHALICYMAGLSLEEAQETYLHFEAADTLNIALALANDSSKLVPSSGKNLGSEVMQVEDIPGK
jgi:integrase